MNPGKIALQVQEIMGNALEAGIRQEIKWLEGRIQDSHHAATVAANMGYPSLARECRSNVVTHQLKIDQLKARLNEKG